MMGAVNSIRTDISPASIAFLHAIQSCFIVLSRFIALASPLEFRRIIA
jgi:hypothetical protein